MSGTIHWLWFSKNQEYRRSARWQISNNSAKFPSFDLASPSDCNIFLETTALVLPQITDILPSSLLDESIVKDLR